MPDVGMRVVHHMPGRARLEAQFIRGQPDEGRRVADTVAAVEGVIKVEARTATGSVVIFYAGDWSPIAARLAEATGAPLEELSETAGAAHALDAAANFVDALDQGARRGLGGRTDLSELTFIGLVVAGTVQLARGQVFGPAATLFGQALTLMAARRSR